MANSPSSFWTGLSGILAGLLYRADFLPFQRCFRIPDFMARCCARLTGSGSGSGSGSGGSSQANAGAVAPAAGANGYVALNVCLLFGLLNERSVCTHYEVTLQLYQCSNC